MAKYKNLIKVSGRPYFIFENKNGFFNQIDGIISRKDFSISLVIGTDKILEIGKDIEEVNLCGLNISIQYPIDHYPPDLITRDIINDLRNFARISKEDYVSYNSYQGNFGRYSGCRKGILALIVEPRLFKKI